MIFKMNTIKQDNKEVDVDHFKAIEFDGFKIKCRIYGKK
jgi:hypothetical protein